MDARYVVYFYEDSYLQPHVNQSDNLSQLLAQASIFSEDNPSGHCEIWDLLENKLVFNMKRVRFG